MIEYITVTNPKLQSLKLELRRPTVEGLAVIDIDGLAPPRSNVNMTRALSVDGALINSVSIEPRTVKVYIRPFQTALYSVEQQRLRLYSYFPVRETVALRVKTDQRDALLVGVVESNTPDIFSKTGVQVISILSGDSFMTDYNTSYTFFSGIEPVFEFPFENPSTTEGLIEFGDILQETQKVINYTGDVPTGVYVRIDILGTVGDITIYNQDTGENFTILNSVIGDIMGTELAASDRLYLDTRQRQKTLVLLREGVTYNVFNAIDQSSSWIHLYPGDNLIYYLSTVGVENLQFQLTHNILYAGV